MVTKGHSQLHFSAQIVGHIGDFERLWARERLRLEKWHIDLELVEYAFKDSL